MSLDTEVCAVKTLVKRENLNKDFLLIFFRCSVSKEKFCFLKVWCSRLLGTRLTCWFNPLCVPTVFRTIPADVSSSSSCCRAALACRRSAGSRFLSTGDMGVFWSRTPLRRFLWHANWCSSSLFILFLYIFSASLFWRRSPGSCLLSVICRGSLAAAVITDKTTARTQQSGWQGAADSPPPPVSA